MQRAAIARALISQPRVLLADEPTGNLDEDTGGEIVELLRDLNRDEGLTIVMVTHNLDLVADTDRVVRITAGRIERARPPPREPPFASSPKPADGASPMATTPRSRSTASSSTRPTPRSASTTTACSTATASSRASASTTARSSACKEHIDRLYDSASAIELEIPLSRDEMIKAVEETVAGQQQARRLHPPGRDARRRHLGLDPRKCEPQVIIIVDDISLYPPELYENGLEIITAATIRNHPAALSTRASSR